MESPHQGGGAGIDRGMKRRQIKLPQSVFGYFYGIVIAAAFRRAVTDEVLRAGGDAVGRVQMRSLVATNIGASDRRSQKRIFAGAFGHSSPARIPGNIHHGRESPANAASGSFTSSDAGGLFDQIRIPTGGQPEWNRKFRSESVNHVQAKKNRYVQPGLFDSNALVGIDLTRGRDVEQRPHFAFADHVVIIRAAGSGASWLSGGVLDELADLFLQSHLLQESFEFFFGAWIAQTRLNGGARRHHGRRFGLRKERLAAQQNAGRKRGTKHQDNHDLDAPNVSCETQTRRLEISDLDFGGSMLNRFSPHIKGMDSCKRVLMRTLMELVALQSLCETIRQIHPYGSFQTHPGLLGAKKRQRKY